MPPSGPPPSAPPSPGGGSRNTALWVIIGALAAAAAILVGVLVALSSGRQGAATRSPAAEVERGPSGRPVEGLADGAVSPTSSGAVATSEAAPTTVATTAAPPSTTTTVPPIDPEAAARTELDRLAAEGRSRLPLDGRYGIQLSSKWVGVEDRNQTADDGSHVFHAEDILSEHERLRSRFGSDVLLVEWRSFGEQKTIPGLPAGETIYVTILDPGGLTTRDQGRAWCDRAFPEISDPDRRRNRCLPRELVPPY